MTMGPTVRGSGPDRRIVQTPDFLSQPGSAAARMAKVILAGVGVRSSAEQARLDALDESERAEAELRARSLLYVAATRARDELVVIQR